MENFYQDLWRLAVAAIVIAGMIGVVKWLIARKRTNSEAKKAGLVISQEPVPGIVFGRDVEISSKRVLGTLGRFSVGYQEV